VYFDILSRVGVSNDRYDSMARLATALAQKSHQSSGFLDYRFADQFTIMDVHRNFTATIFLRLNFSRWVWQNYTVRFGLFQLQFKGLVLQFCVLSAERQKMENTEENIGSAKKQLAANDAACLDDDDEKQFHKLFTELVAECTASDDPKLADSMKWLKQASL